MCFDQVHTFTLVLYHHLANTHKPYVTPYNRFRFYITAMLVYNISMSTVGIIAEYNPFHNGHEYHLKAAKELSGAKYAIAVMSGDFVQRGEPSIIDKYIRTRWALEHGADMVLLLPTVFSLANAQAFASAGVGILHGTGIVNHMAFGSECGDMLSLAAAAQAADNESPQFKALIKAHMDKGLSYPGARAMAWHQHTGEASLLSSPNDILGIEYIRALNRIGSHITPLPIPRTGPNHDSSHPVDSFASASAIRAAILESNPFTGFVPASVFYDIKASLSSGAAPRTLSGLSRETVYALRRMTKAQLSDLPDMGEGLENLLYATCRQHGDISDVLTHVKSRRYTMARLKRICMCALLGISGDPMDRLNGLYIRVLGVRKDALELLSLLKKNASLPVVIRYGDSITLTDAQRSIMDTDLLASEIAPAAAPLPSGVPFDFSHPLITV